MAYVNIYSQKISRENFLILTYEFSEKKQLHKSDNSCWIIKMDSLGGVNKIFPLYIDGFSKTLFNNCLSNKTVDITSVYENDEWNFNDEYKNTVVDLRKIITERRKNILSMKMVWNSKKSEKLKIFITPIQGFFCNCPISKKSEEQINYRGNIFLPVRDIKFNEEFWKNNDKLSEDLIRQLILNKISNTIW